MDEKELKRWNILFDSYFNNSSMSEEWRTGVRRLLADETFEEEKFAVLEKYFNKMVEYDPNPDYDVLSHLEQVKVELSFPDPKSSDYIPLDKSVHRTISVNETYTDAPSARRPKIGQTASGSITSFPLWKVLARSAAVLILVVSGIWFYLNRPHKTESPQVAMVTISISDTPTAQGHIKLPDGSDIWEKPGTTIGLPENFSIGEKRRMLLEEGEVYLDVTTDSARQFVVETAHLNVNVLGTRFDVQAGQDKEYTIVTLYSGQIKADGLSGKDSITEIRMKPGERLFYNNITGEYHIEKIGTLQPEWITQKLNFFNTPMGEILHTYEWYYGVKIKTDGGIDTNYPYTFRIPEQQSLERSMEALKNITGRIDYSIKGNTIEVKTKN